MREPVVLLTNHPGACALVAKTERCKAVNYFALPRPPNDKGADAQKHMINETTPAEVSSRLAAGSIDL